MPRPRSLTSTSIASAALTVIDRDGAAGLSMRAVAAELRVGAMTLYRYVADREELELLVTDLILSAAYTVPDQRLPWRARVAELAESARAAAVAHPAAVPVLLAHRHNAPHSLRWSEAMLAALTEAGLTGQRRAVALRCVVAYITGALQAQHYGPIDGPGTAALASLPRDDYPLLAETAADARSGLTPETEFRQGLDILLDGLASSRPPDPG